MRIKLDENLPARLHPVIEKLDHDVDTVHHEGLAGRDDQAVWNAAQQAKRFFITQDLDFSDMRRFTPGRHEGLMVVRLRDPSRRALIQRIQTVLQNRRHRTMERLLCRGDRSKDSCPSSYTPHISSISIRPRPWHLEA